ncbi:MT-A70-domain-containing protein [Mycena belliarum]|uniref:MT-A70-domain-containing protein n=1 Tax=Mycena belliarum TaxID=1033014 RepID=A0AAD6TPS2_9AGAR|nr:MT-A70-domain-containing protein [Mycena belliae]
MATTTAITGSANDLLAAHSALILQVRTSQQGHRRQLRSLQYPPSEILDLPLIPSAPPSPVDQDSSPDSPEHPPQFRADLPPAKRARAARYKNYVPEEETIRNDYSQRYVDGGEWPQNWVLGADPERRFEEYPKQQRLLGLKKTSVNTHAVSPSYLPFAELATLHPAKFDVILLDPPFSASFTWAHLQALPVPALAADPSFVFLWVGSGAGEGLESGREVLAKWGYRRCEDVVWVRTNKTTNRGPGTDAPTSSLLTRTKQHCLIGIRGTVRRSTDSWFVHCNVDTDVIFWEGDAADPTRKPPEMYTLIENFCLGTRRLELFGRAPASLRRGWVTALAPGQDVPPGRNAAGAVRWDRAAWEADIRAFAGGGKAVVPTSGEIDALRPKSPFRPGAQQAGAGGGGGARRGPQGMGQQGQGGAQGQGQLMAQPMMGMGMGMGMSGEGMMQWPGMMGGMGMGMGGIGMGYGFGGGMAGGWGDQGQFGMGDQSHYGMGEQGQYAMGDQGHYAMGDQGQYAMGDGGWDDGMAGMNAMGGAGLNGMNGSGMNAMNGGMNAMGGGMGVMGQQQWGAGGGFEGY